MVPDPEVMPTELGVKVTPGEIAGRSWPGIIGPLGCVAAVNSVVTVPSVRLSNCAQA